MRSDTMHFIFYTKFLVFSLVFFLPLVTHAEVPEVLSGLGLFVEMDPGRPAEGLIPYELNTPHFADYATLSRYLKLPEGTAVRVNDDYSMAYPVGTMLILTVSYPGEDDVAGSAQLMETRVLIYRGETWDAHQYVWNEAMTEAHLRKAGGSRAVRWPHDDGTVRAHTYHMPNQNQCMQCHAQKGAFVPLGPMNAANLNRRYEYADSEENQLRRWARLGVLEGLPIELEQVPAFPVWDDPASASLEERARAYLDMNCAACHQPGGIAYTSGLDLRFAQREPGHFGVYKSPVAAGRGAGIGRFDIVPGKPEESVLLIRMISTDPGVRMPIVGRGVTHEEGVALVREWIAGLAYPALEAEQEKLDERRFVYEAGR